MSENLDWIYKRRSIRAYRDEPISDGELDLLLQAAMAAPSANDRRPWAFVAVRSSQSRQALAGVHQWSSMCANAPLVMAVLGDPQVSSHWVEDCSAATENLLLAVAALDLGAVWVAIYPNLDREASVRTILGIPEHFRVLCLVPIGRPLETKPPRTRYEQNKVYYDRFGNSTKTE